MGNIFGKKVKIQDVAETIKLLQVLKEFCTSKFDYFVVGLIGYLANYFYYNYIV